MKDQKLETQLNLNKNQLAQIFAQHAQKANGLQELYEALVNQLMQSERRVFLEAQSTSDNKANGYRSLTQVARNGQLQLRVPRDRQGIFRPLILGLLRDQAAETQELCYELYTNGLTTRSIGSIVKKLYGPGYSRSSISRISSHFHEQIAAWLNRPLSKHYPLLIIDALQQSVKRGNVVQKEAFYIVMALNTDQTRTIISVVNHPQESSTGWEQILQELRQRGLQEVGLILSDNLSGLDGAIARSYPKAQHQKCVRHFMQHLQAQVRHKDKKALSSELRSVFDMEDRNLRPKQAENRLRLLLNHWGRTYPSFKRQAANPDLGYYFTYLNYDYRVRRMLYTTNWIERFNREARQVLKIRCSLPSGESARMLIGSVALRMSETTYQYPISRLTYEEKLAR